MKNATISRISFPIIKRRCLCPTVTHILKRRKLTSTPQMVVDERHHKVRADTRVSPRHIASPRATVGVLSEVGYFEWSSPAAWGRGGVGSGVGGLPCPCPD